MEPGRESTEGGSVEKALNPEPLTLSGLNPAFFSTAADSFLMCAKRSSLKSTASILLTATMSVLTPYSHGAGRVRRRSETGERDGQNKRDCQER